MYRNNTTDLHGLQVIIWNVIKINTQTCPKKVKNSVQSSIPVQSNEWRHPLALSLGHLFTPSLIKGDKANYSCENIVLDRCLNIRGGGEGEPEQFQLTNYKD